MCFAVTGVTAGRAESVCIVCVCTDFYYAIQLLNFMRILRPF